MKIAPVRVFFPEADRKEICRHIEDTLASGMVAQGKNVKRLEDFWAEYCGTRFATACSSGGSALEIAMRALNVGGKDVLVPSNTFIATANAVLLAGGNPILLDADPKTFSITLEEIQKKVTPNTAGVIAVHIGGIMTAQLPQIQSWCQSKSLWLVEDAAHAHGSELNHKRAGKYGICATYSFFSTKVITSGEGGMLVTDDEALAKAFVSYRDYGKPSPWESTHNVLSSNYRMNEIAAIPGYFQSLRLDEFIAARTEIAEHYKRLLQGKVDIVWPEGKSSWYKFITLPKAGIDRNALKGKLKELGIGIPGGVYDLPVHQQPIFASRNLVGTLPQAEDVCARHVCLPIWVGMTYEEVEYVAEKYLDHCGSR